jgi:gluconate 5-dehydrogenase
VRWKPGEDVGQVLIGRAPMQRWATVDEMTGPAVFMASDASSFVTGLALVVDGGLTVA